MGAPDSGMQAAERPEADTLLSAFRTIASAERGRHARVLNYWLSIRGDKEFPPLHDLDPLELTDAGPTSILLELISGGHDAEIRHVGEKLKTYVDVERIIDAPNPSLLACIAKKLPIVAISRDFHGVRGRIFNRRWGNTLLGDPAAAERRRRLGRLRLCPGQCRGRSGEGRRAGQEAEEGGGAGSRFRSGRRNCGCVRGGEIVPSRPKTWLRRSKVAEVVPEPVEELADLVAEEAEAVEEIPVEASGR